MDGNGRWAKKRGLPRSAGHSAGAETFRTIANYCKAIGVKWLTVYAFSTENWKRSAEEVSWIMSLLEKYLIESIEKMERDGMRLVIYGDETALSPRLRALMERARGVAERVEGFTANVCVNYGGRAEILRAVRQYNEDYVNGTAPELTEESFSDYLYTSGLPEPELLIRTGGEKRISNFLLWQLAYTEMYFTDTLWPDFGPDELDKAIEFFNGRERRFGAAE
jgi:undecaprenyl diphosphate synthase